MAMSIITPQFTSHIRVAHAAVFALIGHRISRYHHPSPTASSIRPIPLLCKGFNSQLDSLLRCPRRTALKLLGSDEGSGSSSGAVAVAQQQQGRPYISR